MKYNNSKIADNIPSRNCYARESDESDHPNCKKKRKEERLCENHTTLFFSLFLLTTLATFYQGPTLLILNLMRQLLTIKNVSPVCIAGVNFYLIT